jgi:hypothetical protein
VPEEGRGQAVDGCWHAGLAFGEGIFNELYLQAVDLTIHG